MSSTTARTTQQPTRSQLAKKLGSTNSQDALARTAGNARSRISVVFGDPILDAGHTATPNLILNSYARLSIAPQEMMFIIHLLQHKWDARDPYPSLGSVASRMGVSLRQVQRYEASLVKKGYLSVHARISPERGQMSNEYNFAPLIERILALNDQVESQPDEVLDEQTPSEQAHQESPQESHQERHDKTRDQLPMAPDMASDTKSGRDKQRIDSAPLTSMSSPPLTPMSGEEEARINNTHTNSSNSSKIESIEREEEGEKGKKRKQLLTAQDAQHRLALQDLTQGNEEHALPFLPSANRGRQSSPKDFEKLSDLLRTHVIGPASSFEAPDTPSAPSQPDARPARIAKRLASGPRRGMLDARQRLSEVGKAQEESRTLDGSAGRKAPGTAMTTSGSIARTPGSARIADLIRQISQEFGDPKVNANISQADRLWSASGLNETAFLDWLYTIRSETRTNRSSIRRPMAYFFTILRRRLRLDSTHRESLEPE